ncbi:MAG TPA: glycine dehydrogenase, partial [Gammaproteobacteria bacterium]|nr:glycine dehydrogenase [Gammaproteobacteria bacterium]
NGAISIAVINPLAHAILKPPGEWGDEGVDICCGEGQPLGIPLSSGGPYLGFICCRQQHVRQMPGRIIGGTEDLDGKRGYALTLQAREQHIRRSKATSNICTNQGLMVTAATIYMALLGGEGMAQTAAAAHANTGRLVEKLCSIDGVDTLFDSPVFHESVLRINATPKNVLRSLAAHNVLGGYDMSKEYPELGDAILVCATEKRTEQQIESFRDKLDRIMNRQAKCPVTPKFDQT